MKKCLHFLTSWKIQLEIQIIDWRSKHFDVTFNIFLPKLKFFEVPSFDVICDLLSIIYLFSNSFHKFFHLHFLFFFNFYISWFLCGQKLTAEWWIHCPTESLLFTTLFCKVKWTSVFQNKKIKLSWFANLNSVSEIVFEIWILWKSKVKKGEKSGFCTVTWILWKLMFWQIIRKVEKLQWYNYRNQDGRHEPL